MILIVQHTVRDYEEWKSAFDGHETVRALHGCTGHLLYRDSDKPNDLTILLQFPTRAQAQAFYADPELKEIMDRAGVISAPRLTWVTEAEAAHYPESRAA